MLWIILVTIVGAVAIAHTTVNAECSNHLPDGKKAVAKFVKQIKVIEKANGITKGHISVLVNNTKFEVVVVDGGVPDGLEYSTIPQYTYKSVLINGEEVSRVHTIRRCSKEHHFLEFSCKRKMSEVDEIVKSAYLLSDHIYDDYISKTFTNYKSFYVE